MKKLIASAGMFALGASALYAQFAPGLTPEERAKDWSVGATLRGFYDDNYLTLPNDLKRSSYGVEVSPSFSLNHSVEQTSFNLSYIYDLQYYEDRSTTDQSHQLNAKLNHAFSELYSMSASETFIYSSEPTVIDQSVITLPLRTSQDNIHNSASMSGTAELTKELELQASYQNDVYAYEQTFGDVFNPGTPPAPTHAGTSPSYSALLDRMEQLASLSLDWKVMPDTTVLAGYQFGNTGYTSPEAIIYNTALTPNVYSKIRDSDSHYFFVGADEDFTSVLHGSIRAGGEYLDYYNAHANTTSPYVDANLTWQYMAQSYAQFGVKHLHNATDVVGTATGGGVGSLPVLDEESTAAYGSLVQTIAGGLTGSILGQYQHSSFNGGTLDGKSEDFMIVGLNLAYRFTAYLNAEAGYNWNKLVSDVSPRDYTRNQVYIGVRASY